MAGAGREGACRIHAGRRTSSPIIATSFWLSSSAIPSSSSASPFSAVVKCVCRNTSTRIQYAIIE